MQVENETEPTYIDGSCDAAVFDEQGQALSFFLLLLTENVVINSLIERSAPSVNRGIDPSLYENYVPRTSLQTGLTSRMMVGILPKYLQIRDPMS